MSIKNLIIIAAVLFILGSVLAGQRCKAGDPGPETMELKTVNGKKTARFSHRAHQESLACKQCHHEKNKTGIKLPYVEGMKIRKCASCHNNKDMSNPKFNSFKLAAHGLCKECHRQYGGTAPTKCSGCHIK